MTDNKLKKAVAGLFGGIATFLHLPLIVETVNAVISNSGTLFTAFFISSSKLGNALPPWVPTGVFKGLAVFFGVLFVGNKLADSASKIKKRVDD